MQSDVLCNKLCFFFLTRRFAHLLVKKDICNSETKKDLLKKVKNAISATAERFSGYMQNVSTVFKYFINRRNTNLRM